MSKSAKKFERILEKHLESELIPFSKGNTTSIGSYKVVETRKGYVVEPLHTNDTIATTFSKTAAFAIAKLLSKRNTSIQRILEIDKEIAKDYTDCVYYKYILDKSTDNFLKDAVRTRFDISYHKTQKNKKKLESFIL